MDENTFKDRILRLNQVGQAIEKLPAEIRSEAFLLLAPYITQEKTNILSLKGEQKTPVKMVSDGATREEFFRAFDHSKPSDNVRLICAYLYREHGTAPFSTEEVVSISNDVGITIPGRVDMTLKKALANGKSLFTPSGRGIFKLTVHGEVYMKETYGVTKGNKEKVAA